MFGLLIYDETKRLPIETLIRDAAGAYEKKLGMAATVAQIHDGNKPVIVSGIDVQLVKHIRPNCVLVGREN